MLAAIKKPYYNTLLNTDEVTYILSLVDDIKFSVETMLSFSSLFCDE